MTAVLAPSRALGTRSLVAIASIITIAFMGSVIVTPLYPLYQRKLGFSEITLTLIYATYVIGNVIALMLFGQISDQVGRKRVAIPALALAAVSGLLFLVASDTTLLFLGRAVIGLAVGVASGTGTAWLVEEFGPGSRPAATLAAAIANVAGVALGPLVGGALAQYGSWPLRLPLLVYIGLVVVVAIAVAVVRETPHGHDRRLSDVRIQPRLGVPRDIIGAFAAPAVCGFVTFALGGIYFALIPGIVRRDIGIDNVLVDGLPVTELAAVAIVLMLLGRRLRPPVAMRAGLVALLPAAGLVVVAQAAHSMPLLLVAAALGGVTLALGYRGSLQIVNEIAPDDRRAEVVSSYFIACFVGNALPVIGLGVVTTLTKPLTGSIVFAVVIGVLGLGALVRRT